MMRSIGTLLLAAAVLAGVPSTASAGDGMGRAVLVGPAPKARGGASVVVGPTNGLKDDVVWLRKGAALGGQVPDKPADLEERGNTYVPHVLPVMVGQKMRVRNNDRMLHDVVTQPRKSPPRDVQLAGQGTWVTLDGARVAETYRVRCGVHPTMTAWVVVLDHPFFAVTGDDGTFDIPGLKPGKYTLVAWQEAMGSLEAEIEVGPDGKVVKPAEFQFQAEASKR
jgi:plastocyanin